MGHYKKLYKKLKNSPKDVMFDDLEKLMTRAGGFTSITGKGDHYVFSHPELERQISVDCNGKHRPLLPVYVKKSIKAFDEVNPDFLEGDE